MSSSEIDVCQRLNVDPTIETFWRKRDNTRHSHINKSTRGTIRAIDGDFCTRKIESLSNGIGGTGGVCHNKFQQSKVKDNRRGCHQSHIIKTIVQNINLECVKPQRAGVIIYTVINGFIYFGLGLDSKTHDLTDFGGGVSYKNDLNAICGALREFQEETLEIFDDISFDDIKQCPVIYDNNNLIIFIHMNVDPDATCIRLNEKYKKAIEINQSSVLEGKPRHHDPEVCGITWLTWEEFQYSIKTKGVMFLRVQRFLIRAGDFSHLL